MVFVIRSDEGLTLEPSAPETLSVVIPHTEVAPTPLLMLICFLGGFDDGELCHETVIHSFCLKLNFKCEQLEQRWLKKKRDEKDYTEQDLMHQNTPTFLKLSHRRGFD